MLRVILLPVQNNFILCQQKNLQSHLLPVTAVSNWNSQRDILSDTCLSEKVALASNMYFEDKSTLWFTMESKKLKANQISYS